MNSTEYLPSIYVLNLSEYILIWIDLTIVVPDVRSVVLVSVQELCDEPGVLVCHQQHVPYPLPIRPPEDELKVSVLVQLVDHIDIVIQVDSSIFLQN